MSYICAQITWNLVYRIFRTLLLSGGALTWPDCQVPGWSWYSVNPLRHQDRAFRGTRNLKKLFKAVLERLGCPWTEFDEDLIGRPYHTRKFLLFGKAETGANLHASLYYGLLSKYVSLGKMSSIIEIGGGFGALLGRIALKHPITRLFLTELPRMTVQAYYYLKNKVGAQLVYEEPYTFGGARVNVILPWIGWSWSGD